MYDAQLGRFHSIDADAENYFSWTPFNYVGNNPITRIDPDGNNGWDVIKGVAVAALDNATGINLRESVSYTNARDFNRGQDTGDLGSMAVGAILTVDGVANMGAGGTGLVVSATATLATVGSSAPVTLPGAAASAGLIAKGTVELAAGKLLMANGGDSFKNQKGRAKERSGSSKNEKHGDSGRAQTKAEKQLSELRERAQNATGTEKKKLQQKIKNIQETAKQKAKGEEHSRANKR